MTAAPVANVVFDVGPFELSGLLVRAPEPRGLIVALHGGAARASYFDSRVTPIASLLDIGAATGFTVLALDRPGYGASAGRADDTTAEQRAELVGHGVAQVGNDVGNGTVLVAHSMGCLLATRMAAEHRCPRLVGLELCGTGLCRAEPTARRLDALAPEGGARYRAALRDAIWGPPELYPAAAIELGTRTTRGPAYELDELSAWSDDLPELARSVAVPVRYTLAEHERWWTPAPEGHEQVGGLFVASPRLETHVQSGSGHNVSVGWEARAYHVGVLSFAVDCTRS